MERKTCIFDIDHFNSNPHNIEVVQETCTWAESQGLFTWTQGCQMFSPDVIVGDDLQGLFRKAGPSDYQRASVGTMFSFEPSLPEVLSIFDFVTGPYPEAPTATVLPAQLTFINCSPSAAELGPFEHATNSGDCDSRNALEPVAALPPSPEMASRRRGPGRPMKTNGKVAKCKAPTKSKSHRRRLNHNDSASRSRGRFTDALDELWNQVPSRDRYRLLGVQDVEKPISRAEKVQSVILYIRQLRKMLDNNPK